MRSCCGMAVRRSKTPLAAATLAVLLLTSCTNGGSEGGRDEHPRPTESTPHTGDAGTTDRPNIVFVLTDDLSSDLIDYMPTVQALATRGARFSHYFVTDSLCCPSRASIFTGRFPHNTGVYRNTGPDGGYRAFEARGQDDDTFATTLQAAGYRTGFMGKYLNGYLPRRHPVPPGWDDWRAGGTPYGGYDYVLNENGRHVEYGKEPKDYVTDVLADKAVAFIDEAVDAKEAFALEVATYAPHGPYTPAPRHANAFVDVRAPRGPAFNVEPGPDTPPWLRTHKTLAATQIAEIDAAYRKRVQAVQAVDELLARVERKLAERGVAERTYVVFSSDNGFHMGEHRLMPGKMTAFDSDARVPLVVAGPGVAAGRVVDRLAQNIDLRPTFEAWAGADTPASVDGRNLMPLLDLSGPPSSWRTSVLIEHRGPVQAPDDPDNPDDDGANPPTYDALRTDDELHVEYVDGVVEHYDLAADPHALTNLGPRLTPSERTAWHDALDAARRCRGDASCWAAQGQIA